MLKSDFILSIDMECKIKERNLKNKYWNRNIILYILEGQLKARKRYLQYRKKNSYIRIDFNL